MFSINGPIPDQMAYRMSIYALVLIQANLRRWGAGATRDLKIVLEGGSTGRFLCHGLWWQPHVMDSDIFTPCKFDY